MSRAFRQLVESQIKKADVEGRLSGLAGEGKPLPDRPGDALIDPADAVGYRIMAEHGALPEEIELKAKLDAARAAWRAAETAEDRRAAMTRIAELDMRHAIARDARRKFLAR